MNVGPRLCFTVYRAEIVILIYVQNKEKFLRCPVLCNKNIIYIHLSYTACALSQYNACSVD